ncbi:MAG TPA: UvrB/UvrC motif-containing protein, partial [Draconibacterium sp.]|nr:UvrB/UvrC motif-containing protein [Draconibacterium sp.]
VIMYADKITNSMQKTIDSTNYRREKQMKYNIENNITPTQIIKPTREIIGYQYRSDKQTEYTGGNAVPDVAADPVIQYMSIDGLEKTIEKTKKQMKAAAKELDFIEAARLRDEMFALQNLLSQKKNSKK